MRSIPRTWGGIMIGDYHFLPCTPAGVMELLKSADVEICGRDCVVIGRSNIVGKPMAMLLLHQSGTVTICHKQNAKPEGGLQAGGYFGGGGRNPEVCHRGYG